MTIHCHNSRFLLVLQLNMSEQGGRAFRVCNNCRARKRKCSKELPSCSLCTKLLLKCDYNYGLEGNLVFLNNETDSRSFQSSRASDGFMPDLQAASSLLAALADTTPDAPSTELRIGVSKHVFDTIVESGETLDSLVSTYCSTIDVWLPVVSKEQLQNGLDVLNSGADIPIATLFFAILLITRIPDGESDMRDQIYYDTKSLYSLQVASGNCAFEVVQAGLLISIYEHAHGILEAARSTINGCTRIAARMLVAQRRSGVSNIQNTDIGRLWWGIVIIDRYMNIGLSADEMYLESGLPSLQRLSIDLPDDDEVPHVDPTVAPVFTPSGVRTDTHSTRLGPFCHAAKAAVLLGEVQDLMVKSTCSPYVDIVRYESLDASLRDLGLKLMEAGTGGWEKCCSSIGLCFAALLSLHMIARELSSAHNTVDGDQCATKSTLAIRSTVTMILDICRRFNMDIPFINIPSLPPAASHTTYLAALLHIQFAGERLMTDEWNIEMLAMKKTIETFTRRWNGGKQFLNNIEAALSDELRARTGLSAHASPHIEVTP
ncbi:hypothetical protein F5884DRAFT_444439 [Xylogone sp. PMI_703]|nr:hypothetical protein F5884DRAFT_444439 [Xylogone sp. PMI_703]